jgi:hypothetical protein
MSKEVLEIERFGIRNGVPMREVSVWAPVPKDTKDKRAVHIEGYSEELWILTSINDVLVDMSIYPRIADSKGMYFVPPESEYWVPLNAPLREGVTLIDKEEYNRLYGEVFSNMSPISDMMMRKSLELRA